MKLRILLVIASMVIIFGLGFFRYFSISTPQNASLVYSQTEIEKMLGNFDGSIRIESLEALSAPNPEVGLLKDVDGKVIIQAAFSVTQEKAGRLAIFVDADYFANAEQYPDIYAEINEVVLNEVLKRYKNSDEYIECNGSPLCGDGYKIVSSP